MGTPRGTVTIERELRGGQSASNNTIDSAFVAKFIALPERYQDSLTHPRYQLLHDSGCNM
ncbi:MAG: hypothetical protein WCQ50_21095 [Spirochaetota bacterium]